LLVLPLAHLPCAAQYLTIMRVALFVSCLVDLMRPSVGFATIRLLEAAGCAVEVPASQTCCGQPAYRSGDQLAGQEDDCRVRSLCLPGRSQRFLCRPDPECLPDAVCRRPALAQPRRTPGRTLVLNSMPCPASLPAASLTMILQRSAWPRHPRARRALLARVPGLTLKEMPCRGVLWLWRCFLSSLAIFRRHRQSARPAAGLDALPAAPSRVRKRCAIMTRSEQRQRVVGKLDAWLEVFEEKATAMRQSSANPAVRFRAFPTSRCSPVTSNSWRWSRDDGLHPGRQRSRRPARSRLRDLPQASTLCQQCSVVCPVRIPLPGLLRQLRQRQTRAGLRPRSERLGLRLWAWLAARPALYYWLAAGREHIEVLPIAPSWSAARDLPAPQGRTFHELYRQQRRGK
jgi:hypothetical protein